MRARFALRHQRRETVDVDAVRNALRALGTRAVGNLALTVGLVQRDDVVGGVIGELADRLEEAHPQLAEIADARDIALEHAAVVANPLALQQVDLAFFRIDAVFRNQQRPAGAVMHQRAEKAAVTGRHRVIHPRRQQLFGDAGKLPQRLVHDPHGPEIIGKRRIGAVLLVLIDDRVPRRAARQKLRLVQRAFLAAASASCWPSARRRPRRCACRATHRAIPATREGRGIAGDRARLRHSARADSYR